MRKRQRKSSNKVCSFSNVNAVEVIGSKAMAAFGALALSGIVASFDASIAENMIALSQKSVDLINVAARACQLSLNIQTNQFRLGKMFILLNGKQDGNIQSWNPC